MWTASNAVRVFVVACVYFIAAKLSLHFAIPPGYACPVWPAAAFALCACLQWGRSMVFAIWAGATLANMSVGLPAPFAVAIGVGNCIEALVASILIKRHLVSLLERGGDALKFAMIAVLGAAIAASVGMLVLLVHGALPQAALARNWLTWWLGDATAILILVPLAMTWPAWSDRMWTARLRLEYGLFAIALGLYAHAVFGGAIGLWAMPYMVLALVIWTAHRYGLGGVCSAIALVAVLATVDTMRGLGPFVLHAAQRGLNESLLDLQIFLSVISFAGIVHGALLAQRARVEHTLRMERNSLEARVAERAAQMHRDIDARLTAEQLLHESNQRYRAVVELSPDAIFILDATNRYVYANPAALVLCGAEGAAQLLGKSVLDFFAASLHQYLSTRANQLELGLPMPPHEEELLRLDGSKVAVEAHAARIVFEGKAACLVIVRDISERRRVEQRLHLAAQVFDHSPEGIAIADARRRIVCANAAYCTMVGYANEQVLGRSIQCLRADERDGARSDAIWRQVATAGEWQGELVCRRRGGLIYPARASIAAVRDDAGVLTHYIVICADISEHKAAESKIRFMAEHDFLTGLPTRALLLDRLGQAIAIARRSGGKLALMFVDLDHFKPNNDTLGHAVGDGLLQSVAARLKACLRGADTVCRQGGDEFIIMLAELGTVAHAAHVAAALAETLVAPFHINGDDIFITASIGIAIYPDDAQDVDMLIKHADVAMYHAKKDGGAQFQFFNVDMNRRANERLALESSLRAALDKHEFVLEYQPEVSVVDGRTIGVEALVRWRHPKRGLLLPAHFIGATEDCGLIAPIGNWVLRTACQQARIWQDSGMSIIMSVNLSVVQFRQTDFVRSVIDALDSSGVAAGTLELEITESVLIDGADATIATLDALRALGVRLAIDDFGTGYSSLSYLKRFKVDKLKIDQSFLNNLGSDPGDAIIIGTIIAMAKNLRLTVLAEGVETAEQLRFLTALGCDEYQGFFASKSLSASDFVAFNAVTPKAHALPV
ncbi:MAG: EAL domain-containing protein [Pseudomonadota bacterium]